MRGTLEFIRQRAGKGDAAYQFEYALQFHVKHDYAEAKHWYELAARKGHAFAQNNLALLYQTGCGVELNYDTAAHLFTMPASAGLKEAQYNLGVLFLLGNGLHKSAEQAVNFFGRSAEQRYPRAAFRLACCYQEGTGVKRNFEKSAMLFRQAYESIPPHLSDEERVNSMHALMTEERKLEEPRQKLVAKKTRPIEHLASEFITKASKFSGVPDLKNLDKRLLKRIVAASIAVLKSATSAKEKFMREVLGLNRLKSSLDQNLVDFLRELSEADGDQRLDCIFRERELIYLAAVEKNIPFFKKLGGTLAKPASDEQILWEQMRYVLVHYWTTSSSETTPLCFFTLPALRELFLRKFGQDYSIETISNTRNHFGLKPFNESWFHVPKLETSASGVLTPVIVTGKRPGLKKHY